MVSQTCTLTRRLFFVGAILVWSAALAMGQLAGGLTETTSTRLGGNNYIVGTVYTPEGVPIKTRMRIKLASLEWGDILATTDENGKFIFSEVGAGLFTIIIDREKEYEPVSHEVSITRARNTVPETYFVSIRLRAVEEKRPKAGVVSAANAGVPKVALDHYEAASKLAQEKDYKGAIKELKLAVSEYPQFVNAHNQIGLLYLRLNELDNAESAFKAALKINPEAHEPLLNRGVALYRLGKFKDAESSLRASLKVKADTAVAYYYLGRTLNKLNRNEEAEAALLTCLKSGPDDFREAHRVLAAIYLDRGALPRVVEELETYLKVVPTAPDADNLKKVLEQTKRALGRQ
ncbi:MAG TPA: tetratricopeptide repeat protein [Pyrinomonadaceae bacterium]|jgi:TolA-binding protein|nr:tetratricopeptide repeat protein [Pyrinomonadaceae bacterium]